MNRRMPLALVATVLVTACTKEPSTPRPVVPTAPASATTQAHVHGERRLIGEVQVGEHTIAVYEIVKVEAGKEADFDLDFPAGKPLPATVRGWVGLATAQGSMKVRFEKETESRMHGHPVAPDPIPADSKLWLEIGDHKAAVAFRP